MKLKEYAEKINKMAEKYPDAQVIYAKDDEGNDFREAVFSPAVGNFEDGEFDQEEEININAVCIN